MQRAIPEPRARRGDGDLDDLRPGLLSEDDLARCNVIVSRLI